jgi:hypothetical protein
MNHREIASSSQELEHVHIFFTSKLRQRRLDFRNRYHDRLVRRI